MLGGAVVLPVWVVADTVSWWRGHWQGQAPGCAGVAEKSLEPWLAGARVHFGKGGFRVAQLFVHIENG